MPVATSVIRLIQCSKKVVMFVYPCIDVVLLVLTQFELKYSKLHIYYASLRTSDRFRIPFENTAIMFLVASGYLGYSPNTRKAEETSD